MAPLTIDVDGEICTNLTDLSAVGAVNQTWTCLLPAGTGRRAFVTATQVRTAPAQRESLTTAATTQGSLVSSSLVPLLSYSEPTITSISCGSQCGTCAPVPGNPRYEMLALAGSS